MAVDERPAMNPDHYRPRLLAVKRIDVGFDRQIADGFVGVGHFSQLHGGGRRC